MPAFYSSRRPVLSPTMKLAVGKEGKKGRLEKDHEFELPIEQEIDPDSIRLAGRGKSVFALLGKIDRQNEKFQRKGWRATLPESACVKLQRNLRRTRFVRSLVVHD